jgi:pimeloyl-ACP methyl ester carboxylesterase
MIFINNLYQENFPRYDRPKYSGYLQFSDVPDYAYTVIHFPSGKNSLAGYIFGEENTKGLVVIAAGRGGGGEKYLAETLYFVDHGWRVFSFDYTGSYASEGENMVGLPQSRSDLEAALAYIENNPNLKDLPVMLWGHSWGGYAVTSVLKDHSDISAVVSAASYNSPYGLMDEYVRSEVGVLGSILYPFEWAYQTMRFGKCAGMSAVEGINSSDAPVMIIHDSADEAIAFNGASIIAQRERITNPNVVYITHGTANGSGHMDLLRSEAAIQYKNQKNQEFQVIFDRYEGKVPDSKIAAFQASVNHFQTSELDAEMMDAINSFYESALLK